MIDNKLKEIRMRDFLMTQTEFANFLNISRKTYAGWENNISRPNLESAMLIAKKLNKSIEEIWFIK